MIDNEKELLAFLTCPNVKAVAKFVGKYRLFDGNSVLGEEIKTDIVEKAVQTGLLVKVAGYVSRFQISQKGEAKMREYFPNSVSLFE